MPEFLFVHSTKIVGVAHPALKMYPVNFFKKLVFSQTLPCVMKLCPVILKITQ